MAIKIWTGSTDTAMSPRAEDFEITYAGAVLDTYEENGYDDSDFLALVWDAAESRIRSVQYAITRGWTYNNSATPDATPEAIAAAEAWLIDTRTRHLIEDHATTIAEGSAVRSLTTRGKAKDLVGSVQRVKDSDFGGKVALVSGTKDGEPATAWVDTERLQVTTEADPAECRERAESRVRSQGISSCYRAIGYGRF